MTDPDFLGLIPSDTFKYTRLRSSLNVLIVVVLANLHPVLHHAAKIQQHHWCERHSGHKSRVVC